MAKDYQNHDVAISEDPTLSEQEQEHREGMSMLIKLAIAAVVIASMIISISCLMQFNDIQKQLEADRKKLDYYEEQIGRLKYYINKEVDDEYIAEYAREYLNYYFPDEEIYYNDDKQ